MTKKIDFYGRDKGFFRSAFLMYAFAAALLAVVGAFLWPYSINTWLVYFGKQPHVLWWHGAILGVIPGIGQIDVPLAVITWIVMIFIS